MLNQEGEFELPEELEEHELECETAGDSFYWGLDSFADEDDDDYEL